MEGVLDSLAAGEKVIVDSRYHGHNDIFERPGGGHSDYEKMKSANRACHETINQMFKEWSILEHQFRYCIQKHGIVFGAIANIVQLSIQLEYHKPFMVTFRDS